MRAIVRGIPNFIYTQTHEDVDLDEFVNAFTLTVRERVFGYRGEYHTPGAGKLVMLYVEGVEDNRALLEGRCLDPSPGSMRTCIIKVKESGEVRLSGTDSYLRTGEGYWYLLDPTLDPRYPEALAKAKAAAAEASRRRQLIEEQEEALRQEVDDIVDSLGAQEALRRLKGEQT